VRTECVVKNALALFVRNDASKQKDVEANAKDVKVEKVVKKGEDADMRSARRGAAGVLESNCEYLAAASRSVVNSSPTLPHGEPGPSAGLFLY